MNNKKTTFEAKPSCVALRETRIQSSHRQARGGIHLLHLDEPDEFNQVVLEFLRK